MKITITKKNGRSQLFCTRTDGTTTHSNVGPTVPFHDLAHFVVEKDLGLQKGFYGNIANGFSIEELSDKNVIRTLGDESWVAEIVTRAVQSLSSGACTFEDFLPMIRQELNQLSISFEGIPDVSKTEAILKTYLSLVDRWKELPDGESMILQFS